MPLPSSTKSTRSSQAVPRKDLYDLEEEHVLEKRSEDVDGLGGEDNSVGMLSTPRSKGKRPLLPAMAEVFESPRNAPGSGQRLPAGGLEAHSLGTRLQGAVGITARTPKTGSKRKQGDAVNIRPSSKPKPRQTPIRIQASSAIDAIDELSPDQPSGRGRRSLAKAREEKFSDVEEEGPEDVEEAEEIDDVEAALQLRKRRGRKSKRARMEKEAMEEKEAAPERESPEEEPEQPDDLAHPAKESHSRPRKNAKSKSGPAAQRQPKQSKPVEGSATFKSRDVIPVTVHRLTKPILYNENDSDADILNAEIPFAKRSGVNAVDVLSQICEEVIESGLATLEDGGATAEDAPTRREYRTKLRAVEAFQEELRTRLLELVSSLAFFIYNFIFNF